MTIATLRVMLGTAMLPYHLRGEPAPPAAAAPRKRLWMNLAVATLMTAIFLACQNAAVAGEGLGPAVGMPAAFDGKKIFVLLFLMLGPVKVLGPFVAMTQSVDVAFRRRLATRSILFSTAILGLAGGLGRSMLENFNISVPVLALTGGLILFLVALDTVLHPAGGPSVPKIDPVSPRIELAFNPLAFPVIVTPYGVAAVIVFSSLAGAETVSRTTVAGVVLLILLLDWLAMLFAEPILKRLGTVLQIFAVVLGVAQIALGLQVMLRSLIAMGVIPGGAG